MKTNQTLSEYARTQKRVEHRLYQIERRLGEADAKLDHIIFRLIEEDPRIYLQSTRTANGHLGRCNYDNENHYAGESTVGEPEVCHTGAAFVGQPQGAQDAAVSNRQSMKLSY